jgi:hypothetical protein
MCFSVLSVSASIITVVTIIMNRTIVFDTHSVATVRFGPVQGQISPNPEPNHWSSLGKSPNPNPNLPERFFWSGLGFRASPNLNWTESTHLGSGLKFVNRKPEPKV